MLNKLNYSRWCVSTLSMAHFSGDFSLSGDSLQSSIDKESRIERHLLSWAHQDCALGLGNEILIELRI